jgi:hypothetical protein
VPLLRRHGGGKEVFGDRQFATAIVTTRIEDLRYILSNYLVKTL